MQKSSDWDESLIIMQIRNNLIKSPLWCSPSSLIPFHFFQIMSKGALTRCVSNKASSEHRRPLILFPFRSQRLDGDFITPIPRRLSLSQSVLRAADNLSPLPSSRLRWLDLSHLFGSFEWRALTIKSKRRLWSSHLQQLWSRYWLAPEQLHCFQFHTYTCECGHDPWLRAIKAVSSDRLRVNLSDGK